MSKNADSLGNCSLICIDGGRMCAGERINKSGPNCITINSIWRNALRTRKGRRSNDGNLTIYNRIKLNKRAVELSEQEVKSSERVVFFIERHVIVSTILQFVGILWSPMGIVNRYAFNSIARFQQNLKAIYLIHSPKRGREWVRKKIVLDAWVGFACWGCVKSMVCDSLGTKIETIIFDWKIQIQNDWKLKSKVLAKLCSHCIMVFGTLFYSTQAGTSCRAIHVRSLAHSFTNNALENNVFALMLEWEYSKHSQRA